MEKAQTKVDQQAVELLLWCQTFFKPGCFLGDLCREPLEDLTDNDLLFVECAREGYNTANLQAAGWFE